jgi:peroxiredoxin
MRMVRAKISTASRQKRLDTYEFSSIWHPQTGGEKMRTRILISLLFGGMLALSLPGCTGGKDAKEQATQQESPRVQEAAHTHIGPQVGEKAPTFSLKDVDGKQVNLADMVGKNPLVLVFWGTWCPHCVAEVPALKKMQDQYKGKGVNIVSVAVRHPTEKLEVFPKNTAAFVKTNKMNYTVLLDGEYTAANLYHIEGVPTLLVLDKEGVIRSMGHAAKEAEEKLKHLI